MKIVLSDIPGYFPSNYNEQLYLDARSVGDGKDYFFVETADKFQITNDDSYRNRKIQTVFYDKYTIEFVTTESIAIGVLNIAEVLTIIQESGETHIAEILDSPESTKMQNSEFRLYTITYRDLNSKTTVNHLTFDSEDNPQFSSELYIRKLTGEDFDILKSKIIPVFSVSEYNRSSDNSNSVELVNSESAFKTITYHAYLSELDKNIILQYVNSKSVTGSIAGTKPFAYIKYDSVNYTPIETPIVTVDKGELEGLFYVTVTVNYNHINNYPYE